MARISYSVSTASRFDLRYNQASADIRLDNPWATVRPARQSDWRLVVDESDPANCEGLDVDPSDTPTSLPVFALDTAH